MAHITQEEKKIIESRIKPILKEYGVRGTFSVRHHMDLVLTIWEGPIDFIGNYNEEVSNRGTIDCPCREGFMQVNEYWYHEHFTGIALEFLNKVIPALKTDDWYCDDDIQSDYFNRKYYYTVKIGTWDKPYILKSSSTPTHKTTKTVEVNSMSKSSKSSVYSLYSNQEMVDSLNEMGTVIADAKELHEKNMDISSVVRQLSVMMDEIEKEIETRRSKFNIVEENSEENVAVA
jgi:hypothetical protein